MAIRVALQHKTIYQYDRLVSLAPHIIRLRPAAHSRTPVLSYSLSIQPVQHFLNWQQDPQGNYLARVVFPEPTRCLEVLVDLVADLVVINPFDFFLEPSAETYPFAYEPWLGRELTPYLETEPAGPKLQAFLERISHHAEQTVAFLVQLNQRLQQAVQYIIRMESGIQSCEETLTIQRGSVGIVPGCWCRFCVISVWQRDSCRDISFSSCPMSHRSTDRLDRRRILPICTPGLRCICLVPAG